MTRAISTLPFFFHVEPIVFIDLDRSLTPAPREPGRKSVPASTWRRKDGNGKRYR